MRFDSALRLLSEAGLSASDIATAMSTDHHYIKNRMMAMGLNEAAPRSTTASKIAYGVAMLAALGFGTPTIARMLHLKHDKVQEIVTSNQEKIEQIKTETPKRGNPRRVPTYSMPVEKGVKDTKDALWLARTLFAEAADQSIEAKQAVAQVIMNRVRSKKYPNTVIGVISQKWQFSCYPNSRMWKLSENPESMGPTDRRVFMDCMDVARDALSGRLPNRVGGATLYHDVTISCPWASNKVSRVAEISDLNFYVER